MYKLQDEKEDDQKKLEEIRAKDGFEACVTIMGKDYVCYFRTPTNTEWKVFLKNSKQDSTQAQEQLVRSCALHPTASDLGALFEKKPGLITTYWEKLAELVGFSQTALLKNV